MEHADLLGRVARLPVRRFGTPGAFLALDPTDDDPRASVVLLPRNEVSDETRVGDTLEVFLYCDSDDRWIATRRTPLFLRDEVAFARVTDVTPIGAFVDWGLVKELLVPHAEQTRDLGIGERHPIGLYVDRSGRLAGTMRVTEMLRDTPKLDAGAWVEGEAWRRDPDIGVFVIVQKRSVGLIPNTEPTTLARGDAGRA